MNLKIEILNILYPVRNTEVTKPMSFCLTTMFHIWMLQNLPISPAHAFVYLKFHIDIQLDVGFRRYESNTMKDWMANDFLQLNTEVLITA